MPSLLRPCLLALVFVVTSTASADQTGIDVAPGLVIRQVADDDLVPDCTTVTVDSAGRVIASGPGYIRLLIDQDADGRFDDVKTLVDGPSHGAHGLCCDADDLYFVGDQGVWKVVDTDHDGIVDSAPARVLEINTGGEHDAHALRKGPDGHWYLIAGNGTKGMFELQNVDQTQVVNPRAGALWRISPDWSRREVWAHGFRNAYDFDFAPDRTIVTFDSDGERDVSLPWYRPTRVFRVQQGDDAGWVSRSWKRPDLDPQMPRVLGEFGRGSPTGVLRYRHRRLPTRFHDGIFVLDWTFGQIHFVSDDGSTERVAEPSGTTGFAVTDIDELADGRLIVSVGGRGSRGGLYVIDATDPLPHVPPADVRWTPPAASEASPTVNWIAKLRNHAELEIDHEAASSAIDKLRGAEEASLIAAITLLIESVGGLGPGNPKDARGKEQVAAVFDGYRSVLRPKLAQPLVQQATDLLLALVNTESSSEDLRREVIRGLAVIEPDSKRVFDALVADLARVTSPTEKLHRLIALARLPVSRSDEMTEQVVAAMIEIPPLIEQFDLNVDRNWNSRLAELFDALARRDSLVPSRLVSHPDFGHSGHLVWTETMDPENLERARQLLLDHGGEAAIDPAVAVFIARGNDAVPRRFINSWLAQPSTQPAAWLAITRNPNPNDVGILQEAALSIDQVVRERARKALQKLGADIPERTTDSQAVKQWLQRSQAILARKGNADSGKQLFIARQCANCHNGAKALGPSLQGISKRFSSEDILRATVDPHHTIADRYRAKQVVTTDGNVWIGMAIYESVDGLTLLTADAKTIRINQEQIEVVKVSTKSLMPEGLLEGLYNDHVADLLAYLQSL